MSISVTLNGRKVEAEAGQTILEVARSNGISIPTLCHDDRLKPYGSCRVCLVKVEGARSFVPSCSTEITEGMVIDTEDGEVKEARRLSLALLISDHYGDCVSPCSLEQRVQLPACLQRGRSLGVALIQYFEIKVDRSLDVVEDHATCLGGFESKSHPRLRLIAGRSSRFQRFGKSSAVSCTPRKLAEPLMSVDGCGLQ